MQHPTPPLLKEVADHLFQFEEKIFGMPLQHLLSDLGALLVSLAVTGSLSLPIRLIICVGVTLLTLLLVHGTFQGISLSRWLFFSLRMRMIPTTATWRSVREQNASQQRIPSIQECWIPLTSLEHDVLGYTEQRKGKETTVGCYCMMYKLEGNIHALPEGEQVRIYRHFETFLCGLEFRVKFITHTQQVDPAATPGLAIQKQALTQLSEQPLLHEVQTASFNYQEHTLQYCTSTHHFVAIIASVDDEVFQRSNGIPRSPLERILYLFTQSKNRLLSRKSSVITRQQVLTHLQIRGTLVKKALQQLDIRVIPLIDTHLLSAFASCLIPGASIPSFKPIEQNVASQRHPNETRTQKRHTQQQAIRTSPSETPLQRTQHIRTIQGLHETVTLTTSKQERVVWDNMLLADLLAPTRIEIQPKQIVVDIGGKRLYQRYFKITGYGNQILCGCLADLSELGLPMLLVSHFDPQNSQGMIRKLEQHLIKLESQRLSNEKTLRLTKADQIVETEQIRRVMDALARKTLKVFAIDITICIHASSLERLEERSHYLLSHLHQKQFRVRPATRSQDLAWQACLPTVWSLDEPTFLPSDACSTLLHCNSSSIGTPTGPFIGYTGTGLSRKAIYLNPWSTDVKPANPHMVVIGQSGMGKSWSGKTFAMGLICMGIADVAVLDRDDDFLEIHKRLKKYSQRFDLAKWCPFNLLLIPYGPDDVEPDDPGDLVAEFIDQQLIVGLALAIAHNGFTKGEEAYLKRAAIHTYAAKGITGSTIQQDPDVLLLPMPTLHDLIATMQALSASNEEMRQSLIERLEAIIHLFPNEAASLSLDCPLTIFSIRDLDEGWYPLMTYMVQTFLRRHRAQRQDERYLAFIVEEASYMLKNEAGRKCLELGARGFRKLGIAQITLSQHPREFLEEGAVVLSNADTALFFGMQEQAAEKLHFPPELQRILVDAIPGQGVMRCGNRYAPISIASIPQLRALFTTDPEQRRRLRERKKQQQSSTPSTCDGATK